MRGRSHSIKDMELISCKKVKKDLTLDYKVREPTAKRSEANAPVLWPQLTGCWFQSLPIARYLCQETFSVI